MAYFAPRYFAPRYFAGRYFAGRIVAVKAESAYFAPHYFAPRYFAPKYFTSLSAAFGYEDEVALLATLSLGAVFSGSLDVSPLQLAAFAEAVSQDSRISLASSHSGIYRVEPK